MAAPMPHFRFTVDEYEQMIEVGILAEEDRVELLKGEIIAKSPIGARHAYSVTTLIQLLVRQMSDDLLVTARNPIRLPDGSEPQPDIAIIRAGDYRRLLPTGRDVLIAIEVSDTTREYDRETKLPLYAAAGIPEAWLVDPVASRIERYTEPEPDGYHLIARFGRGALVASVVVPTLSVPADVVLGVDG